MQSYLTLRLGELAALGTALCWTASAMAFAAAGRRIGSLVVNLIRLLIAALLLALGARLLRGLWLPLDAPAAAWGWLAASGLVGFVFGDLCLFRAFVEIGPRLAALVMCLAPLFAALFGWLALTETLTLTDASAMALIVGGIGWAVWERRAPLAPEVTAPPTARGVLLAVGGAVGQAGGLVLAKHGMADLHPLAATQIRVLAGIVGFTLVFAVLGRWQRLWAGLHHPSGLAYTTIGAFFGPFLGVSLSLFSVQRTAAGIAAALMATSPVLLVPIARLRGERVGVGGWLGALAAVGGVALLLLH